MHLKPRIYFIVLHNICNLDVNLKEDRRDQGTYNTLGTRFIKLIVERPTWHLVDR
jgi:hypothetical protein